MKPNAPILDAPEAHADILETLTEQAQALRRDLRRTQIVAMATILVVGILGIAGVLS